MRVKLLPGIANDAYYGVGGLAGPEAAGQNASGSASAPGVGLTDGIAGSDASTGVLPSQYSNSQNQLAMPGTMSPGGMQTGMYGSQDGPSMNRVVANPDGSHDVYSFDATGSLRGGQNYDANGNLVSSSAYDPNERGGTLTYTRFNPDGSAQVDKAGGGLQSSYTAGSDGQIQDFRQAPLNPADAQKLEQWKASSEQSQAAASNLTPDAQPAAASDVGGADMAGIGAPPQPTAQPIASAAQPTMDGGGADMAGSGAPQPAAQPIATAAQPMDGSGGDMAGSGTPQPTAQPIATAAQPMNGSGGDMAGSGTPQPTAQPIASAAQPTMDGSGADMAGSGTPQPTAQPIASAAQPTMDGGGADMAGSGTPQPAAQPIATAAQPMDGSGADMTGSGTPQPAAQPTASAAPPTMDGSGADMASPDGLQRLSSQLSSMAPGLANELLPKIASDLKSLIEQLLPSAMQDTAAAQPAASSADSSQPSLTTAGS